MSLRLVKSANVRRLAFQGVSLSLGAMMLASGAAFAQTSPSASGGDVIVNTEPDRGSNVPSGSGSSTPLPSGSGSTTVPSPVAAGTRFACQATNGQYTVMYMPENLQNQAFPWAVPSAMGGGWNPERRCNEIARRLESYRPDGLVEMKTGFENGYNTICVTTDRVPSCRIVLTVPQGQDPQNTRDRVFQNLTVADSGQQTQGVLTYGNSGSGILGQLGQVLGIGGRRSTTVTNANGDINLKPFLSRKDGGTGERLVGGVPLRSNPAPRTLPRLFRR